MDILVIGNGFDIAHGLPTKYKDFLYICSLVKYAKLSENEDKTTVFIDHNDEKKEKQLQEFFDIIGLEAFEKLQKIIRSNFWINYFSERQKVVGSNWIDFENEIKVVLEQLHGDMLRTKWDYIANTSISNGYVKQYCNSHNLLNNKSTFRELFEKLLVEQKNLIYVLELYMDGYVNKIRIKKRPYISRIHVDKVLSFNYTSIYENNYAKSDTEFCYIHGKADINSKKSRIVLGFDDHYINDTQRVPELIPFEKYYQRIVNENDNQYIDWTDESGLRTISDPIENIYVFGHSFGTSDGDVLRKLLLYRNVKTTIYYHDEIDRAEKIKNLAMILGPDNLIKLTGGAYRRITFETD